MFQLPKMEGTVIYGTGLEPEKCSASESKAGSEATELPGTGAPQKKRRFQDSIESVPLQVCADPITCKYMLRCTLTRKHTQDEHDIRRQRCCHVRSFLCCMAETGYCTPKKLTD